MYKEEEKKKFEMEENGEKEWKKRLDKEALCERLIDLKHFTSIDEIIPTLIWQNFGNYFVKSYTFLHFLLIKFREIKSVISR